MASESARRAGGAMVMGADKPKREMTFRRRFLALKLRERRLERRVDGGEP